jgi:hypothetical protein
LFLLHSALKLLSHLLLYLDLALKTAHGGRPPLQLDRRRRLAVERSTALALQRSNSEEGREKRKINKDE